MKNTSKLALSAFALAAMAAAPHVLAQNAPGSPQTVTVNDPAGAPPDPSHIPFTLPKDIKWTGRPGQQETAHLYGDPSKPGPYAVLIKWYPGNFSHPHFHTAPRWIYVVSGTWWVSSSSVYNEKLTYPVPAGSFVQDMVNTIHWDGSRAGDKEPAVLLITGIGPSANTAVDENGKPVPRGQGRGAAPAANNGTYPAAPAGGR